MEAIVIVKHNSLMQNDENDDDSFPLFWNKSNSLIKHPPLIKVRTKFSTEFVTGDACSRFKILSYRKLTGLILKVYQIISWKK